MPPCQHYCTPTSAPHTPTTHPCRLHIDDPVDAASVHLFCGAWGVLAVGFFATEVRVVRFGCRVQLAAGCGWMDGHALVVWPAGCLAAWPTNQPTNPPRPAPPSPLFSPPVQTSTQRVYGYANDWGVFYGGSGRQLGMQVGGWVDGTTRGSERVGGRKCVRVRLAGCGLGLHLLSISPFCWYHQLAPTLPSVCRSWAWW